MPFIIETWGKPGRQHVRQGVRQAHLQFLSKIAPKLIACGPKLDDDGSDAGGGLYIVDVETRAEAETLIEADPFTAADLFQRVEIRRWGKAYVGGVCHLPGQCREGHSNGAPSLHYRDQAPLSGKTPRHTVVLSHALGTDLNMWDALAEKLSAECRVISYDHRGHGSSDAPAGLYDIAALADDAAQLLRELEAGPVIWIGLSMGGMVGQELALRHPALVKALVIANSTSSYPEAARANWTQRIATVQADGIEAIADAVMARYFTDRFRAEQSDIVAAFRRRLVSTDRGGYIGCCHAVGNVNTDDRLNNLAMPVLVIAGELDAGTPLSMAQKLIDHIPNARLDVLKEASHVSVIEQPQAFADSVSRFISTL